MLHSRHQRVIKLEDWYPCELMVGSNTVLHLMLHMSVTGVTKLHICNMDWQLVAVDNG